MKRKFLFVLIAFCLFVPCAVLTACGGGNDSAGNPVGHTHAYTCQVTTDEYLCEQATCTLKARYYWSCSCGEKDPSYRNFEYGEALGHTPAPATCQESLTCSRCGQLLGGFGNHSFDEGVVLSVPTCSTQGETLKTCSVCGKEEHIYSQALGHKGEWYVTAKPRCFDSGNRQRICTVCNEIEDETLPPIGHHELQPATCTEGKKCKNCHYVEGTGTGHAFEGEWTTKTAPTCLTSGVEERKCAHCDATEERNVSALGHTGNWKITTPASCTTTGTETRTCTVCNTVFGSREIPAKGHSGDWTTVLQSTCTTQGKAERRCNICGDYEEMTLPKAMHTYSDWVVDRAADCSTMTNGQKHRSCTVCGYNDSATIFALHNYSKDWTIETEPTCTTDGSKYKSCTSCNSKHYEKITKTGHKGEWTTTLLATCTTDGSRERTCTVCGDKETETLNKLGHDLVSVNYTSGDNFDCITRKTCSRCGHNEDTKHGRHSYSEPVLIFDPDCERDGLEILTCLECGYQITHNIIRLGHKYDATLGTDGWVTRVEPTCTKDGWRRRTCTVCNKAFDDKIYTEGHQYGDWTTKNATCTVEGSRYHECTKCGLKEQEILYALGHDFGVLSGECYGQEGKACTRCSTHIHKHVYGDNGCTVCGLEYTKMQYVLSDDGTYYIAKNIDYTALTSKITSVFIRKTYNGKPVEEVGMIFPTNYSISSSTESNFKSLKYFIFPDGIKIINKFSEYSLMDVEGIILPDSVTTIGAGAFKSLMWLKYINAPQNLKSIGYCAFGYPDSGAWWEAQNDGIIYFGNLVYGYKGVMPEGTVLTLRDGTIGIATCAFDNKSNLKGIVIPDGPFVIEDYAFRSSGLESFTLRSDIELKEGVFDRCSKLTNLTIENGVTKLLGFSYCGITCLVIPDSVVEVCNGAFTGCSSLISIKFGSGLTTIGEYAFNGCGPIETLTIPSSIQTIGNSAFNGSKIKNVVISDGVLTIGDNAFYNCKDLKTVKIGNVGTIGKWAFQWCTALTDVTINSCEELGALAFKDCEALENLSIKGKVGKIGDSAFANCKAIKKVFISEASKRPSMYSDVFDYNLTAEVTYGGTKEDWFWSNWGRYFNYSSCTITCSDGVYDGVRR